MKRLFLVLLVLVLLNSCNHKKSTEKQEVQEEKPETTILKEAPKDGIQDKIYKTKSGKAFIVSEEKKGKACRGSTLLPFRTLFSCCCSFSW